MKPYIIYEQKYDGQPYRRVVCQEPIGNGYRTLVHEQTRSCDAMGNHIWERTGSVDLDPLGDIVGTIPPEMPKIKCLLRAAYILGRQDELNELKENIKQPKQKVEPNNNEHL